MKKGIWLLFFLFFVLACRQSSRQQKQNLHFSSSHITGVINRMTDVMVHDVTNPPLAARFFSYATLAGYEVISQNDSTYKSMSQSLNNYPVLTKPDSISGYSTELSAVLAMLETAKKMQPSGAYVDSFEVSFLDSCRKEGLAEDVINNSTRYARSISKAVLSYAKSDRYNRTSNYPRYTPQQTPGSWYPTPPGFFAPVEPYFNTVRPFTLDTCTQFKPDSPVAFSTDKGSAFFKMLNYNYTESSHLSKEHQQIAAFWDCNPFALQDNGHLMSGLKKMSPGAHWLLITGIACKEAKADFAKSMKIHALVSIGLMDGFICCWDEKFRSNRIRPETAIRQYIDPRYKPLLQTPPFPEYLSGHSTISATSAVILSHYFGDHFYYNDTSEESYGLPSRAFNSFQQAALEAGLSRFYGGIHFMDAVNNGRKQGLEVGEWVINRVENKASSVAVLTAKNASGNKKQ
ncbi:MAG: vanadium-dependent haloperoxidase [Bacteroidota bacterium]|nr:vanadium-dependent haloperoxidase [Bacteroidota bacterium]